MRYTRTFFNLLLLCVLLALSGCAKKTTIVLLPDPDGKVGKVRVATEGGVTEIDEAREATTVRGRAAAPSSPKILSEKAIHKDFGQTLAFLPEQPKHFILYFEMDSQRLTAESMDSVPAILTTIKERKSEDISVVGHTDTAGNPSYNYDLSKKRAEAVAVVLREQGVRADHIKITSHGENNPLIPTKDNVKEPKNRRVEVTVR